MLNPTWATSSPKTIHLQGNVTQTLRAKPLAVGLCFDSIYAGRYGASSKRFPGQATLLGAEGYIRGCEERDERRGNK